MTSAPEGRADGMAIDTTGWVCSRDRQCADGVAVTAGWSGAYTTVASTTPPSLPDTSKRMDAWPTARSGPHPPRRYAKRGKWRGKKKRAPIEAALAKAAAAADPRQTEGTQRAEALDHEPAGCSALASKSPRPG